MGARLSLARLAALAPGAAAPGYAPGDHGVGQAHLGVGAFHKAHQAVYTDAALAAQGGHWRVLGASLRSGAAGASLNPQDGLYTVLERGPEGVAARVVGSLARVIAPSEDDLVAALAHPSIRVATLTVTEKAYGVDREAGDVDLAHPDVAADLATPERPRGVLGVLVEALRRRRAAGAMPFTILCCDNLPKNGALTRAGVLGFARRVDGDLARWLEQEATFPSSMVDRITPAATDETRAEAARLTGFDDEAAVETEPFSQWVIEDRFVNGRPAWEAGGAIFVSDVEPYEDMKLRMLNGAHSMLAYAGFLSGRRYVRDAMADPALRRLAQRHFRAAAATLRPLEGVDFAQYAGALARRFDNPAIAHETYQIAMDGTEKLPQRLLAPALDALAAGDDARPFAFAVAAWMRYCRGEKDGASYALRDPREAALLHAARGAGDDPAALADAVVSAAGVFPETLSAHPIWRANLISALSAMAAHGVGGAVEREAFV